MGPTDLATPFHAGDHGVWRLGDMFLEFGNRPQDGWIDWSTRKWRNLVHGVRSNQEPVIHGHQRRLHTRMYDGFLLWMQCVHASTEFTGTKEENTANQKAEKPLHILRHATGSIPLNFPIVFSRVIVMLAFLWGLLESTLASVSEQFRWRPQTVRWFPNTSMYMMGSWFEMYYVCTGFTAPEKAVYTFVYDRFVTLDALCLF